MERKFYYLVGLSMFLLSGCFATQEDVMLLNNRVSNLEASMAKTETKFSKVDSIEARVQALESKISSIDLLSGNYRSLEDTVNSLKDEVSRMRGDLDSAYTELDLLKQRVSALENALLNVSESIRKQASSNATVPSNATATVDQKTDPIKAAEEAVAKGDYDKAIDLYSKYIKENPKDPKLADYYYRVGEIYFLAGKYREAILNFEDFRARYSEHSKVPASYLKEAIAFEKIGDKKSRDILLKMLIDKYPKSREAQEAKKMLSGKK